MGHWSAAGPGAVCWARDADPGALELKRVPPLLLNRKPHRLFPRNPDSPDYPPHLFEFPVHPARYFQMKSDLKCGRVSKVGRGHHAGERELSGEARRIPTAHPRGAHLLSKVTGEMSSSASVEFGSPSVHLTCNSVLDFLL